MSADIKTLPPNPPSQGGTSLNAEHACDKNLVRVTDALSGLAKMTFLAEDASDVNMAEVACLIWLCQQQLAHITDE